MIAFQSVQKFRIRYKAEHLVINTSLDNDVKCWTILQKWNKNEMRNITNLPSVLRVSLVDLDVQTKHVT